MRHQMPYNDLVTVVSSGSSSTSLSETGMDSYENDSDASDVVFLGIKDNTAKKSEQQRQRSVKLELHQENGREAVINNTSASACDLCDKFFVSPRGVMVHKRKTHGIHQQAKNRFISCAVCGYQAKFPSVLKIHERIHNKQCTTNQSKRKRRSVAASDPSPQIRRQRPCPEKRRSMVIPGRQKSKSKMASVSAASAPEKHLRRQNSSHITIGHSQRPSTSRKPNISLGDLRSRRPTPAPVFRRCTQIATEMQAENDSDDADEDENDDIVPLDLKPHRHHNNGTVRSENRGAGAASVSQCASMVISACAQSNLVTFHDVNTARGTIGQITFQFMCNACRGQKGVARCFRGRAYCVMCCGHSECD